MSPLWAEWISFSLSCSLLGALCLRGHRLVPDHFHRLFKYGKTQDKPTSGGAPEVPKSWFFHFYVFGAIFYALLLHACALVYVRGRPCPASLSLLLDLLVGSERVVSTSASSVVLATVLMQLQVARRLYECTRLSVYASSGRMSLLHYLCGFFFYFGVGLSLLAEAPGFSAHAPSAPPRLLCTWWHVAGVVLFALSSWLQFRSHVILARLRKDALGRVVTYGHSVPRGLGFELVSCPHYLAEIGVYVAVGLVLEGRSVTWWMVVSFVAANQVLVAIFNHRWYKNHFPDYPRARRAVIPFLL